MIPTYLIFLGELFRKGKKLKLDVYINYITDDNDQVSPRDGEKRNTRLVVNAILAEGDDQIDAK